MFGVTGLHLNQINLQYENNLNRWKYNINYYIWIICWIVGHIVGGAILFGLLGLIGSMFSLSVLLTCLMVLGIACCVGALHQFNVIHLPMPQLKRQVSRLWLNQLHRNFTAFGYGLQLGSGVATRIKVATTYFVLGCAFCLGSFYEGAVIGAVFGFARSIIPAILAPLSMFPDKSFAFALKFNSFENIVQKINGVALIFSGVGLFYFAFTY
ncbi:MAG: hypothetical protein ACR2MG_01815 [Pyrinomonadaceae bacterium]